jgi:hypothetical protein
MACELENFTKMVDSLANKAGLPANTRKELLSIKEYATTEMAKLMNDSSTKQEADIIASSKEAEMAIPDEGC